MTGRPHLFFRSRLFFFLSFPVFPFLQNRKQMICCYRFKSVRVIYGCDVCFLCFFVLFYFFSLYSVNWRARRCPDLFASKQACLVGGAAGGGNKQDVSALCSPPRKTKKNSWILMFYISVFRRVKQGYILRGVLHFWLKKKKFLWSLVREVGPLWGECRWNNVIPGVHFSKYMA